MQERKFFGFFFFFFTQKLDVWLKNRWESLCPDLNIQILDLLRCVPKGLTYSDVFLRVCLTYSDVFLRVPPLVISPSHFYELQVVNPGPEDPI